jgi:hypothetical protein
MSPILLTWFNHFSLYCNNSSRTGLLLKRSRNSSVGMMGVLGFDSRWGLGIFLFSIASRTALGPTQSLIQWVPGRLSLGVRRPRREADQSPPSSAEIKERVKLYIHSRNTPAWRGAQLKAQGYLYLYLLLKSSKISFSYGLINCILLWVSWISSLLSLIFLYPFVSVYEGRLQSS